jgi:hypothetical protein
MCGTIVGDNFQSMITELESRITDFSDANFHVRYEMGSTFARGSSSFLLHFLLTYLLFFLLFKLLLQEMKFAKNKMVRRNNLPLAMPKTEKVMILIEVQLLTE